MPQTFQALSGMGRLTRTSVNISAQGYCFHTLPCYIVLYTISSVLLDSMGWYVLLYDFICGCSGTELPPVVMLDRQQGGI